MLGEDKRIGVVPQFLIRIMAGQAGISIHPLFSGYSFQGKTCLFQHILLMKGAAMLQGIQCHSTTESLLSGIIYEISCICKLIKLIKCPSRDVIYLPNLT
jgi:hypothetical protein